MAEVYVLKIRIRFEKKGSVKFIGHLDTMRYFQKVMRRAGIDIKYTEGFSPHQIMSFAYPLGVGVTTDGDYLDIEVNSTDNSADSIDKLNSVMADGFRVTEYKVLPDDAKAAMTAVAAASYRIDIREGYGLDGYDADSFNAAIKSFYTDADSISIVKKTKKSEREVDLKPLIHSFYADTDEDGRVYFYMMVTSGSEQNIKPALVMEHFIRFMGIEYSEFSVMTNRIDTYTTDESMKFISLSDVGEDII
ncbi:MAG: TIGR03936 family radical SAM-associated protein [Lachnospiraceae bacterium]|nr:TIGR03936 family radical SAM-associated protein [Lachnospiraceae bacterium]